MTTTSTATGSAPRVVALAASDQTVANVYTASATKGITLNGTVTSAESGSWYFEYGPTASLGQTTATQSSAGADSSVNVSATLPGLDYASDTIYYALVATNTAGTSDSNTESYTFLPTACPAEPVPSSAQTPAPATYSPLSTSPTVRAAVRAVKVTLDCAASAGNCTGTITVVTAGAVRANPGSTRRVLTLASEAYTLKARTTRTIVARLSRSALRLLSRDGRLRTHVVVTAKNDHSSKLSATKELTLKVPNREK
jgi:hypothetical protein